MPHKTLWLASMRYYWQHPWLLLLTIVGLASGVGIVIAIDIAVSSAQSQLDKTVSSLLGSATHQIIGGPKGVEQSVFVDLKVRHGIHSTSPVINGYVYINPDDPVALNVLGVAPLTESMRSFVSTGISDQTELTDFLTRKNAVLISPQLARQLEVKKGNTFEAYIGAKTMPLLVVGLLPDDPTLKNIVVTDIANAQVMFDLGTRLSRIDLDIADQETLDRIKSVLPADLQVVTVQEQKAGLQQLTKAFRINLRAMSLLALLIGVFVVFTTIRFSVYHRMRQFGLYRVIGVTGRELNILILFEVLLLSLVATTLGLLGGSLLATGLIDLVTQTFSDHYFEVENAALKVTPLTLLKATLLGVAVALVTAYLPGREAAKAQPITLGRTMAQEQVFVQSLGILLKIAVGIGLVGIVLISFPDGLIAAFAGLFFCVLGYVLLIPKLFLSLNNALARLKLSVLPLAILMGLRDVRRSLSRTGVAIIAMVIALAATIGVALMVGSFRVAVSHWLDHTMRADIYVSLPDRTANPATIRFADPTIQQMSRISGVRDYSLGRHLLVNSGQQQYLLMTTSLPEEGFQGFDMQRSLDGNLYQRFQHEDVVLITEPFAYHQQLELGDSIVLNTPQGERKFLVIGVYRDYSSESGKLVMSQNIFKNYWPDLGATTVGLYLAKDVSPTQILHVLTSLFPYEQNISIRSRQEIKQTSLQVFDRTFLITDVLRILILGVAVVTVIVSLMSWQLERRRELATAQAIGFLPKQLQVQLMSQSVFMAFAAFVFSIPLGIFIAATLVYIINQRSFGWGMELVIDPVQFLYAAIAAIVAALIAAAYPAVQITRVSPREAMQES